MASFEIESVDSLTSGTVGPQGKRTFFLQAVAGSTIVSFKLEKQQLQAMADYLAQLLEDLPDLTGIEWHHAPELRTPVEPLWAIGAMGAMYDSDSDTIVVMAQELVDDEDEENAEVATFRIERGQTLAFIQRAQEVVDAGRPPCPWCDRPLDYGEEGFCPCWN